MDSYELDGLKTDSRTEKSNLRERDERIGIGTHAITAAFQSKQAAIERGPRDRPADWTGIGEKAGIVKRPPWRSASVTRMTT